MAAAACLAAWMACPVTPADTVALTPSKDNTIFGELTSNSNALNKSFHSGKTASFHTRRALLAFDVAAAIPAGSVVERVTLTLHCSGTPNVDVLDDHEFSLHRLLADWGEGTSNSGGAGGQGTAASAGDATWLHRFFDLDFWSSPGGEFEAAPSASLFVGGSGYYDWDSTPGLVADVQAWAEDPSTNYGWILVGDELNLQTARRFDSRNHPTPSVRPSLTVEFQGPASTAGAVPDADDVPGNPLVLAKTGGVELTLTWDPSCRASDSDYAVYEGPIGSFTAHSFVTCSTEGATTITLEPSLPAAYYLVVPSDGVVEGSYGRDSADNERSQGSGWCLPQVAIPVCP